MNISKSKYCMACCCMKKLWLNENHIVEVEEGRSSTFENGILVGEKARELFQPIDIISYSDNLSRMIENTKELLKNKNCNIAEASFFYHNCFCSVDILIKKNTDYEIYEVKSSTSLQDEYLDDISFQYYILTKLGYFVRKANIMFINSSYEREKELDLEQLFTICDVTDTVKENLSIVEEKILEIQNYMRDNHQDDDCIDIHCFKPYSCPYFSYCTKKIKSPNIFELSDFNKNKMIECYRLGKISFKDVKDEINNQKLLEQIEYELLDKEDKIEKENIEEFMNTLSYPLYFLDFETFQQVIPEFEKVHPYEAIPFQYSLHILEKKDGELQHKEFLGDGVSDPRRSIALSLVENIPKDVCVVAYHKSFEGKVLSRLGELFPDLRSHLENIRDHLVDLEIPFSRRYYYTRKMLGKSSIKYVLPALFPDDPTLDYHHLDGVHNGSEAMDNYCLLGKVSKEEAEVIRSQLLTYCCLDTYAMVKIYFKLLEVIGE